MQSMLGGRKKIYLITSVVLIACGGYYAANHNIIALLKSDRPLAKLSVAAAATTPSEIVARVIKQYNIDKKHGLDLAFDYVAPGDLERKYFDDKAYPFMNMGIYSIATRHTIVPTKIIGPVLPMTYDIVVPKDSTIKTLADLKGKKFGILPKSTAAYQAVAMILISAGINPQTDLQLSFGGVPDINKRLAAGEVDASIVSYPRGAALYATGKYRTLVHLEDVWKQNENGLPFPLAVVGASEVWYSANPEVAKEYVDTWREAAQMLQDHPEIIVDLPEEYLKEANLNTPETLQLLEQHIGENVVSTWGDREVEGIKRFYQRASQYGILPKDAPTVDSLLVAPSALGH